VGPLVPAALLRRVHGEPILGADVHVHGELGLERQDYSQENKKILRREHERRFECISIT
jgi:hypothetical protein